MSTTQEILVIFQRISTRIDQGSENVSVLNKMFTKRAEIEDKFAELLKTVIPEKYDTTDPLTVSFVEDLKNQAAMHAKLAGEIRSQIIVPQSRYAQTMRERQRTLQNSLSRYQSNVSKAQKTLDGYVKDLEAAKAKLSTLPPNKQPGQQQTIQKYALKVKQTSDANNQMILQLHQSSIPSIHTDFSEFDSQRLVKMQNSMALLTKLMEQVSVAQMHSAQALSTKLNNYDGADRSARYVSKTFDPNAKTLGDENDLYAYAIENYRSEDPHDLAFVRGDKIRVLVQHQSGWWDGELNGKKGLFPSSFVQISAHDNIHSYPVGAVFLCRKDFDGKSGGDIPLLSGDLIYVDSLIGTRCSGTNLRTNKRGFFPLDALESKI